MAIINAAAGSSTVAIPRRPMGYSASAFPQSAPAPADPRGDHPTFRLLVEPSDSITPALLSKQHLPQILLQHGPLAIRHITAHLMSSVPGFSVVPPARQRRLVVSALEGRGGATPGPKGETGGVDGDVIFEKVGWGRWDAHIQGQPRRTQPEGLASNFTPESGIFMQSEEEATHDDISMDEADAMSMDGDSSSSEESETDDDMTDEEDWANVGADILRQQGGSPISSMGWTGSYSASYSKSPGMEWMRRKETPLEKRVREEQEAVEALVKLGRSF